jgi:hypothetical protein
MLFKLSIKSMTRGHIFFLYIVFNTEKEITDGKAYKPSAIYA